MLMSSTRSCASCSSEDAVRATAEHSLCFMPGLGCLPQRSCSTASSLAFRFHLPFFDCSFCSRSSPTGCSHASLQPILMNRVSMHPSMRLLPTTSAAAEETSGAMAVHSIDQLEIMKGLSEALRTQR